MDRIKKVQKRTGEIIGFDQTRIQEAIFKALTATGEGNGNRAKKLSDKVVQILNRRFKKDEIPHVEQIQDVVEEVLILEGLVETAKAYILYREQRRKIREAVRVTEEAVERVDQYLEQLDWEVKENANMAFSLQGLNHYATSHVIRKYWLNKIYPKEIREAHESGDLHLDKLDTLGVYCSGWDLYDLLLRGFGGVPGKLSSKPPKHLESALGQAVNFIFTLAGEVAGAVSFSVAPKETIIIKDQKENISIRRIGEFCDSFIEEDLRKEGEIEYVPIEDKSFFTLSFNSEGKVEWKKIKKVIRHRITDPLRLLRTNKGHLHISESHSVYSLQKHYYLGERALETFDFINQRGTVSSKAFREYYESKSGCGVSYKKMIGHLKAKELIEVDDSKRIPGGYVNLIPKAKNGLVLYPTKELLSSKEVKSKNVPSNVVILNKIELPENKKLNLFELISSDEYLASKFVVILPRKIINEIKKEIKKKTSLRAVSLGLKKDHSYVWSLLNLGIIDFTIYQEFVKIHPKKVMLKAKRARDGGIPFILEGRFLENFLKLIAWYISEGNNITNFQIAISQTHPKRQKEIEKLLRETKEITYFIQEKEDGGKKYVIGGTLGALINHLCGKYAPNKRIPSFVFSLSKRLKEVFIQELLKGDGYEKEVGQAYTTTSNLLTTGLNLLLTSLEKRVSIKTRYEENFEKKKTKYWTRYDIIIHQNKETILPFGDLASAVVLDNKPFLSESSYEYDLSVEENENFLGGVGLFGLHNSNFDTLLAPFIRYDRLNYPQVKQALQEFLFNMATPTRVGFQCISEDTEILTPKGWKRYDEIKEDDEIKTLNLQTKEIENKKVKFVFKRKYKGIMYHLKGKSHDQLISPEHRVVRKIGNLFQIQPIEEILKLNPSVSIPIVSQERRIEIETLLAKDIKKINYQGIIWCPHTEAGTIIARRKGKVFITGNCPFSNITLDLKPSPVFAKQPVIIGGLPQKETYQEFEEEMKIFNKAFYEVMLEGDKDGRSFHFPIPTINITKDFPWDEPAFDGIFEASAKYGTNYFANYINSEMKPEEARAMCFPGYTKVIYKEGKHSRYQRTTIRNLVNSWNPKKDFHLLINGKWVKITDVFKLKNSSGKIIKVTLKNGEVIKMTPDHPTMIVEDEKLKQVSAKDLKIGDIIPIAKQGYQGKLGDFELGRWLGLYISEGGITKENTVYFSINYNEKELREFIKKIAEERFAFPVRVTKDPRWNTIQVWVKSKSAVEWIRRFCSGDKAPEKRILASCYGMSREFRLGVLVGIFQGDGYERDVELNTTNRKLRDDVADLARSVGINYTKRVNPNNTKGERTFTSYVLRLCRDSLKELAPYFKNIKVSTSSIFKDFGDFYGIKIKSIKIQNYHASVYDFEVDSKEHLFQLANGVITHNCCRLKLDLRELYNRGGGGLFGSGANTGSVSVITINLPRIGYLSKTKKEFFERLAKVMDLAKEVLEIKRKVLENFIEKGLYPYSKVYLLGVKKMRGEYYGNHFSTIGLIGMNEALLNFLGDNIASKRGRRFALEVLDFMRERLVKYQKETGNIYNLEQTPAESTSYRLALKDKERYPDIITAGTKKVPYYTNSTQLPVNYTDDIFEALKLQDELTCKYTGGSIFHIFLGERVSDIQTVKSLIKKIFENFKLPYITLTPNFSICPSHGYLEGEHFECPKCTIKQPCEVYSRICGYLRPLAQWNIGKQQEFKERKEFKIPKTSALK